MQEQVTQETWADEPLLDLPYDDPANGAQLTANNLRERSFKIEVDTLWKKRCFMLYRKMAYEFTNAQLGSFLNEQFRQENRLQGKREPVASYVAFLELRARKINTFADARNENLLNLKDVMGDFPKRNPNFLDEDGIPVAGEASHIVQILDYVERDPTRILNVHKVTNEDLASIFRRGVTSGHVQSYVDANPHADWETLKAKAISIDDSRLSRRLLAQQGKLGHVYAVGIGTVLIHGILRESSTPESTQRKQKGSRSRRQSPTRPRSRWKRQGLLRTPATMG